MASAAQPAATPHPIATEHLPAFITAPGDTDVLMVVVALILALSVMAFGILFLRLHTLPERIAHKSHKIQFEIVAVLGLIALFTHMHIFWIAGLLLALIDMPDFGSSLNRIAGSTEKLAGFKPGEGLVEIPTGGYAAHGDEAADAPPRTDGSQHGEDTASKPPETAQPKRKELRHA
jgi:hypothetical protein